jgi:hypothetical protein
MGVSGNSIEHETEWKRNYRINNYFVIGFKIINNTQKNSVRDGMPCNHIKTAVATDKHVLD